MQRVIERCAAGEQFPLQPEQTIDHLVDRLCYVNFRQWQLEDAIRDPEISAEQGFALVKQIQDSNAERTGLMELIDRYYVAQRTPATAQRAAAESAPAGVEMIEFHETLGQLVDILSILYVRQYHTAQLRAQGFVYHPGNGCLLQEAIDAIEEQIALCERSFLRLRELFLNGRAALPPLSHFKLYGTPTKSPSTENAS